MKDWKINKEQYKKLLSYIGSGDLPNADVIIFGNEEGAGNNEVYANVEARDKYIGKKDGEDLYAYTLDPNGDYKKGFWNPSAVEIEKNILKIIEENNESRSKKNSASSFLDYCARICLATEDEKNDIDYWFKPKGENKEVYTAINKYVKESLFQSHAGVQTFLMDWRPLPRPNEKWWRDEYSKSINKKCYLDAFDLKTSKKNYEDGFSNYRQDANFRKNILKNAIKFSNAKVLIGLGGAGIKKTFIKEILNLEESDFKNIEIDGIDVSAFMCNKIIEERELKIFLLPFPSTGHGPFKNGEEINNFYREITKQIKACLK